MKKKLLIIVLFMICKAGAQTSVFTKIDSLSIRGQYTNALQLLSKIEPQTFIALKKSGDIYYSIDAFNSSIQFYEKALELKEDYKVQLQLASSYRKIKKYKRTIDIYEKITHKDAENLYVIYQLGKLYAITNQIKKAYSVFRKTNKRRC